MDLSYYHSLLLQPKRLDAFRRAIHQVVRPGDQVLDVGTGLGTYAMFAAEAGAAKIYAVDGDPVIHVATDLVRSNGLADRVECRRGWLPEVRPATPSDVVIFEDFVPGLVHPRTWRLYHELQATCARPDARWIPGRATLRLALAHSRDLLTLPAPGIHGLRWESLTPYLENLPRCGGRETETLLGEPVDGLTVVFHQPVADWPTGGRATLRASVAGSVNAIAMWHVLELAQGIALDNAPGRANASWGHMVIPLGESLAVAEGAAIDVNLRWSAAYDGQPSWLGWSVTHGDQTVRGNEFAGFPARQDDIAWGSPEVRPQPGPGLALVRDVIGLTNGSRTASEIAAALETRYPAYSPAALKRRVLDVLRAVRATAGDT